MENVSYGVRAAVFHNERHAALGAIAGIILMHFLVHQACVDGLPATGATHAGFRSNAMPHIALFG